MSTELYQATGQTLKILLTCAWLLPLAGFAIEVFGGYWSGRRSKAAAYLAVACIFIGFCLSVSAFCVWGSASGWKALAHAEEPAAHAPSTELAKIANKEHEASAAAPTHGPAHDEVRTRFSGRIYTLAQFGDLVLSLDYYIDSLTLVMFMMVTLIATCIHVFAMGYMSDELTEDHVDHEVHTAGGGHFHRPGRYYRFFSYMSLFCFSMLGLVLAGNIFQVFIFWELVGICSYLLIGFYAERRSASTAANKAFIMNRVGDFGFLIGLMILWTSFGTFHFTEHDGAAKRGPDCSRCYETRRRRSTSTRPTRWSAARPDGPAHADPVHAAGGGRIGNFRGLRRQKRAVPAADLASRRDGRSDARFGTRALRHDGRRRRLSGRTVLSDVHARGPVDDRLCRLHNAVHRGDDCRRRHGHQAGARLFDDQPARLHDAAASAWRLGGRGVPSGDARLLQVTHVPLFGERDHGLPSRAGHVADGGPRQKMPITAITMLVGVIAISGLAVPACRLPAIKSLFPVITRRTRSSPRRSRSSRSIRSTFCSFSCRW